MPFVVFIVAAAEVTVRRLSVVLRMVERKRILLGGRGVKTGFVNSDVQFLDRR